MDMDVLLMRVNELLYWKATAEQRLAELERRHGEHAEAVADIARTVAAPPPRGKAPAKE